MGDLSAGLTDMWRSVLLFLPKALAFVAILAVGWIVARAARKVIGRALDRVGFDRAVQRGGIGRALSRGNYDASDIVVRLAYYGLLLLTLQLAFSVWGPNPVSDLITAVVRWLPKAFIAIVIVVVATAIASAVKDLINGALGGLSYGGVVANVASWFIIGLGAIAALNQVGIATTVTTPVLVAALATVAGILIVGVGGGLIRPMAHRWERWLDRVETESRVIRERAREYTRDRTHGYSAGRDDLDRELSEPGQDDATAQLSAGALRPGAQPEVVDRATMDDATAQLSAGALRPGAQPEMVDRATMDDATAVLPAVDETVRLTESDATERIPALDDTRQFSPADATQPLPRADSGEYPAPTSAAPAASPVPVVAGARPGAGSGAPDGARVAGASRTYESRNAARATDGTR